jgi:3-dehydroquinate dehydratase
MINPTALSIVYRLLTDIISPTHLSLIEIHLQALKMKTKALKIK